MLVTAGSPEKLELTRELGADLAINYRTDDFVAAVLEATLRRAQNGNHLINDMAAELEHAAARELPYFDARGIAREFSDHAIELGNGSEPTVIDRFEEKLEAGVIPKHISHLDRQPGFIGGGV